MVVQSLCVEQLEIMTVVALLRNILEGCFGATHGTFNAKLTED